MKVYVDGSGFNGRVSKVCIVDEFGNVVTLENEQHWTNNEAEYHAVFEGCVHANPGDTVLSDSQLVVNQVNGTYKCSYERLRILRDRVREILRHKGLTLQWIPGNENPANLYLRNQKPQLAHSVQCVQMKDKVSIIFTEDGRIIRKVNVYRDGMVTFVDHGKEELSILAPLKRRESFG